MSSKTSLQAILDASEKAWAENPERQASASTLMRAFHTGLAFEKEDRAMAELRFSVSALEKNKLQRFAKERQLTISEVVRSALQAYYKQQG